MNRINISSLEFVLSVERTPLQDISKLLREEAPEESEPVISRNEREKFAINWEYGSLGLLKEDVRNVQDCINKFLETIKRINAIAPIQKLSARELRVDWMLPVDKKYSFRQLHTRYVTTFIRNRELLRKAVDSSVLLDINCEQGILHHESGPMKISQLKEDFRAFDTRRDHPKLFMFLQTEVENKQRVEYSEEDTIEFMRESFSICKSHARRFEKIMEAML